MLIEARSASAPAHLTATRRRRLILAGMPQGRLAVAAVTIAAAAVASWWWGSTGLAVLTAAGFGYLLILTWMVRGRVAAALPPARSRERHWTVTDEALRETDGASTHVWKWAAVVSVELRPDAYVFRQDSGTGFDLPRDALTEAQENELRQFLRDTGRTVRGS